MNAGNPLPERPPERFSADRQIYPPQEPRAPNRVAVKGPDIRPFITYTLLSLTLLIYLAQVASVILLGEDWPAALGLKANELILRGQYWRLITPMFLHLSPGINLISSIMHIGFNMYALNIFGPGLERHFGHGRFLTLYFLSGFAGNVISFVFSPALSLGSSTAIFGLLGAEGVFLYQNREILGEAARQALGGILRIAFINLIIGLSPGIDNWGHIGGLLGGFLFTWLAGPRLKVEGFYPDYRLADEREAPEVFRAALLVGAVFVVLAGVSIYLRGG